jgi:UDP-2,4-diacetamido-2,4,6-trideoxy-beta-L-altropyranose hydrolase
MPPSDPQSPSDLLIRADASAASGTGHVMRMIALAQAWRSRGGRVHLASHHLPQGLLQRLKAEQIQFHQVAYDQPGTAIDAHESVHLSRQLGARWIVADGYAFGHSFQEVVQQAGLRLAIVTDFDYCPRWDCDLLVNQNPHAADEAYVAPPICKRFLGTRFALLRNEFTDSVIEETASNRPRRRLLITLGGSDIDNGTGKILRAIEDPQIVKDRWEIRVLVGTANPHGEALADQIAHSRHQVQLLNHVSDMAAQYRWADRLIGAGGSSCWEWMYFGLQAAIVVIADNQQPIYDHLVRHGIACGLGRVDCWDAVSARELLHVFLGRDDSETDDARRFRHLVDGFGAQRIAAAMDSAASDVGIWLRRAENQDCRRYFDWANDPLVRAQSLTSDPVQWESHQEWFARQLVSADARLWIGMRDERPVGQVRWNRNSSGEWVVSFSVAAEARGSGVGKELIRLGTARMRMEVDAPLTATVRVDNNASARCFQRLGWQSVASSRDDLLQFRQTA